MLICFKLYLGIWNEYLTHSTFSTFFTFKKGGAKKSIGYMAKASNVIEKLK